MWEAGLGANEFSPLEYLLHNSKNRVVDLHQDRTAVFEALVGSNGHFAELVHEVRRDKGYRSVPWQSNPDGFGAYRSVNYEMRMGKTTYYACTEKTVMAAVGEEVIVQQSTRAPDAPIIGKSSKLETVMHFLANSTGGTAIAIYANVDVQSDTIRKLVAGRIESQTERILDVAEEVVTDILQPRRSRTVSTLRQTRFRRSMNLGPAGSCNASSLDPSLWARLNDHATLPNAATVLSYLGRLKSGKVSHIAPEHVQTLENIVVYHRRNEAVLLAAMELLVALAHSVGMNTLVSASPTLPDTLRSVLALQPNKNLASLEAFVEEMSREGRQVGDAELLELAGDAHPWQQLEKCIGVLDRAALIIAKIASTQKGQTALSNEQITMLCGCLTLHIGDASLCENVLSIVSKTTGRKVHSDLEQAVRVALRLHPNLQNKYSALAAEISEQCAQRSAFDKTFGNVIPETVVFECLVVLHIPSFAMGRLYLTKSYLCVAHYVLPFQSISYISSRWYHFQPCIELGLSHRSEAGEKQVFVFQLWARAELMQHISDLGYFKLINRGSAQPA